jgi:hypothetical protein
MKMSSESLATSMPTPHRTLAALSVMVSPLSHACRKMRAHTALATVRDEEKK